MKLDKILSENSARVTLAEILNDLLAWPEVQDSPPQVIAPDDHFDDTEDEYINNRGGYPPGAKVINLYPTKASANQLHPGQTYDDNEEGWSLPPGIILGRVELIADRSDIQRWAPTVQMGNERAAMINDYEWINL